jgi:hypothetical protein
MPAATAVKFEILTNHDEHLAKKELRWIGRLYGSANLEKRGKSASFPKKTASRDWRNELGCSVASSTLQGATTFGVVDVLTHQSQGSSFLATLGFVAESLWDSWLRSFPYITLRSKSLAKTAACGSSSITSV